MCLSPTPENTVIVDVPPAAGRWGRGCCSEQEGGESGLKGEMPPPHHHRHHHGTTVMRISTTE